MTRARDVTPAGRPGSANSLDPLSLPVSVAS
jgi:hypothetical protein